MHIENGCQCGACVTEHTDYWSFIENGLWTAVTKIVWLAARLSVIFRINWNTRTTAATTDSTASLHQPHWFRRLLWYHFLYEKQHTLSVEQNLRLKNLLTTFARWYHFSLHRSNSKCLPCALGVKYVHTKSAIWPNNGDCVLL